MYTVSRGLVTLVKSAEGCAALDLNWSTNCANVGDSLGLRRSDSVLFRSCGRDCHGCYAVSWWEWLHQRLVRFHVLPSISNAAFQSILLVASFETQDYTLWALEHRRSDGCSSAANSMRSLRDARDHSGVVPRLKFTPLRLYFRIVWPRTLEHAVFLKVQ
jgi:hypothetical protein